MVNNHVAENSKVEKDIKAALLKRALGYEYEEKIVEAKKDGSDGKVKIMKKHMPPDPKAVQIIREMMRCGQW